MSLLSLKSSYEYLFSTKEDQRSFWVWATRTISIDWHEWEYHPWIEGAFEALLGTWPGWCKAFAMSCVNPERVFRIFWKHSKALTTVRKTSAVLLVAAALDSPDRPLRALQGFWDRWADLTWLLYGLWKGWHKTSNAYDVFLKTQTRLETFFWKLGESLRCNTACKADVGTSVDRKKICDRSEFELHAPSV